MLHHARPAPLRLAASTQDPGSEPRWFWEAQDRAMIEALGVAADAQVLDAGCGKGNHVRLFAERCRDGRVAALDISPDAIAGIRGRFANSEIEARITTHEADVLKLPFEVATFDLAWSSHTMHVLNDPIAGVRELARVVKPGGRVAIREDGYSMRCLPLDIGVGEPGIESRIQAAFTKWFAADRLARGRVPFGWQRVLENAGLRQVSATSFLFQLSPPFSPMQTAYLRRFLRGKADLEHLGADDKATLVRITEPGNPADVLSRDDLHVTDVSTVYVGSVQE
jgi:SAM-dependent methyltransferase